MRDKSLSLMKKLVGICHSQNIVFPVESNLNNYGLTHYKYGHFGSRLRQNICHEWWCTILDGGKVIRTSDLSKQCGNNIENREENISNGELEPGIRKYFLSGLSHFKRQLPFSIASQVFCYNEEASTIDSEHGIEDKFIFSSAEQGALCVHHYVAPQTAIQMLDDYMQQRLQWWKQFAAKPSNFGLNTSNNGSGTLQKVEIQFSFPWGWDTVETVQNLGCLHLEQLQNASGVSHQGIYHGEMVLPAEIVCSATVERGMLAFLLDAFSERDSGSGHVLRLHPSLVPDQVAIVTSPMTTDQLVMDMAYHVTSELRNAGIAVEIVRDDNGDDGNLAKCDSLGFPWAVVLSEESRVKNVVHLRRRDVGLLEPVPTQNLVDKLRLYTLNSRSSGGNDEE